MSDSESKTGTLPQRLCSEIQLFDLCDLDSCTFKNGRFCTDPFLLGRFEKIAEEELPVQERYLSGEAEDAETDEEFDDGSESDDFEDFDDNGSEDDGWEEE